MQSNGKHKRSNGDKSDARTAYNDLQVEGLLGQLTLLQDQVQFLRCELERKDTILLNITEGLKFLEAPRDTRESFVTLAENEKNTDDAPPEYARPSWWRRLFGAKA